MIFKDRFEAGALLAQALSKYANDPQAIILGIPRGGVQTGYELAARLNLGLDVILTKKIGYLGNKEFAIGSASLNSVFVDPRFTEQMADHINQEIIRIRELLTKRYQQYFGDQRPQSLTGKNVIITDDGIATGQTLLCAIDLVRQEKPNKIIVAVPVSAQDSLQKVQQYADEVVCLHAPQDFGFVGKFYQQFTQVPDQEAIDLLQNFKVNNQRFGDEIFL